MDERSSRVINELLSVSPILTERGLVLETARVTRADPDDIMNRALPMPPKLKWMKEKRRRNARFEDIG